MKIETCPTCGMQFRVSRVSPLDVRELGVAEGAVVK